MNTAQFPISIEEAIDVPGKFLVGLSLHSANVGVPRSKFTPDPSPVEDDARLRARVTF